MSRRRADPRAIQPGDMGIWATCAMKKEAKSIGDLRDLFQEVRNFLRIIGAGFWISEPQKLMKLKYATKIYGVSNGESVDDDDDSEKGDIEAEINKELADIRKPTTKPLFTSIKLDTQCCKEFGLF